MAAQRELIEPRKGDKRYVRRGDNGRFDEVDDVGRSLSRDVKQRAKTVAKLGRATKATGSRADIAGSCTDPYPTECWCSQKRPLSRRNSQVQPSDSARGFRRALRVLKPFRSTGRRANSGR